MTRGVGLGRCPNLTHHGKSTSVSDSDSLQMKSSFGQLTKFLRVTVWMAVTQLEYATFTFYPTVSE